MIKTSIGNVQIFDKIADTKFAPGIGTRVRLPREQFCQEIIPDAFMQHDASLNRAPGQHFVLLRQLSPENLRVIFDAGVGLRSTNPEDYFPAMWRGRVELFGRRKLAVPVTGAAVILYDRAAFLADPDITENDRRWLLPETDKVLVDVLAFDGPHTPPTPERLVANMAGGNNETTRLLGPELRSEAYKSHAYWSTRVVVGDPA